MTDITSCGCNDCGCEDNNEINPLETVEEFVPTDETTVCSENDDFDMTGNSETSASISDIIRNRILSSGAEFRANQNISDFIKDGETDKLVDEVSSKMEDVLRSLVIDTENDWNSKGTARRVAKMLVNETYSGRYLPVPPITSFPNDGYKSLYVSEGITIRSACSHHWQPITGTCWVGILPEDEVIGLSKFNRIVSWISERPQIQEEMTTQIAEALSKYAKTPNVAVIIKASHGCMSMRGVKESCGAMSTAVMLGKFQTEDTLKNEFYNLISLKK